MQVAHANAELAVVFGQIFGHALRQRRDQHSLVTVDALADLGEQVVDLMLRRPDVNSGVEEARRTNHLFDDDTVRVLELPITGRRTDMNHLADTLLPF